MLPDTIFTAPEFELLQAYLDRMGVPQAQINGAIGTAALGRTRAEIAAELRKWLATLV